MNKLFRNTLDNYIPQKKFLQQIVVSQDQENAMIAGFNFSTDLSFNQTYDKIFDCDCH